ncbi:hypothetical protein [Methanobacterium spitsbergense]|uniref:hypothetical protein n=1 Tax=Methanobacterium spitsbergense TaxID=2874285 RepID=UPI001CBC479E|nr:hypothetical protein [Methanobacterium spitsbergense]
MRSINAIIDKSIDQIHTRNNLKELEFEFQDKKHEFLLIQDKPTSSKYKQLLNELEENISKREALILKG